MVAPRRSVIGARRCLEIAKRSHLQGRDAHFESIKSRIIIHLLPLSKFHSRIWPTPTLKEKKNSSDFSEYNVARNKQIFSFH